MERLLTFLNLFTFLNSSAFYSLTHKGWRLRSTGYPQGCILSPSLYTVYTYDCEASHPRIWEWRTRTTIVGLICSNDESHYTMLKLVACSCSIFCQLNFVILINANCWNFYLFGFGSFPSSFVLHKLRDFAQNWRILLNFYCCSI